VSTYYKKWHFWIGITLAVCVGLGLAVIHGVYQGRGFEKNLISELSVRRERLENLARRRELVTLPLESARGSHIGVSNAAGVLTAFAIKEAWVDALWVYAAATPQRILVVRRPDASGRGDELTELEKRHAAAPPPESGQWLSSRSQTWLLMRIEVPGLFSTAGWLYALADPWASGAHKLFPLSVVARADDGAFLNIPWPGGGGYWGIAGDGLTILRRIDISGKPVFLRVGFPWIWILSAIVLLSLAWFLGAPRLRGWQVGPKRGKGHKDKALGTHVAQVVSQEMAPALRRMQKEVQTLVRRISRDEVQRRFGGEGFRNLRELSERSAAKTEDEIKAEEALYANMVLPEGKKTALIKDPNIPTEIVFDFDIGDLITDAPFDAEAAAAQAREAEAAKGTEDYSEGKTKMVDDGAEKKVVFDDTLHGRFDEIEKGI
jgi:hypothetical protein